MKALTFIDYFATMKIIEHNTPFPASAFLQKITEYWKIVAQPFTPNAIESLFEGWKWGGWYNGECMITHTINEPFFIVSKRNIDFVWDKHSVTKRFDIPKTVDEFILYCQKVGIELQFKESVFERISLNDFNLNP